MVGTPFPASATASSPAISPPLVEAVRDTSVTPSKLLALGRTRFLLYSPVMYCIGVAFASTCGGIDILRGGLVPLGLALVLVIHSMTHFFNEYYDYPTDVAHVDPSPWTGGSKVLRNGLLQRPVALTAGLVLCTTAALITLRMVALAWALSSRMAPPAAVGSIALAAIVCSIGYSAPPLRFEARGLGEADVALVLNFLVPLMGYVTAAASAPGFISVAPPPALLAILLPLMMIEFARMMVMNMADIVPDIQTGKLTLPCRIGLPAAKRLHGLIMGAGYVLAAGSIAVAPVLPLHLLVATLPAAFLHSRVVARGAWQYAAPFWASQHNGLCMVSVLLGLLLQSRSALGPTQFLICSAVMVPIISTFPVLFREIGKASTRRPYQRGPPLIESSDMISIIKSSR